MTGCLMKKMSPFYTEGDKLDSATLRLSPQMVKIISSYPPRRNLINPVYLLNPSSVVRFTRFEVEDIPEATCFLPTPGTPEIGTNGKKRVTISKKDPKPLPFLPRGSKRMKIPKRPTRSRIPSTHISNISNVQKVRHKCFDSRAN